MLKIFRCDCGFSKELEHTEYYDKRIECPTCGTGHHFVGSSDKCMETFENALRLLGRGHAEDAVRGFAQAYELFLKHLLDDIMLVRRKPAFPGHNIKQVGDLVRKKFRIPTLTLITKNLRNDVEHDTTRLTTRAEALEYAEHVVATMERNRIELVGEHVLRRGEAGELTLIRK